MRFRSPGYLAVLGAIGVLALVYLALQLRRRRYIVIFPNVDVVAQASPRGARWRQHVTAAVFLLMVAMIVVALARPGHTATVARDDAAIIVALDVSRSMQADDVAPSRFVAAQRAASAFIRLMPSTIRVGVVLFSNVASVPTPPTRDHDQAVRAVEHAQLGDGTAVGDALFQALLALRQSRGPSRQTEAPAGGPLPGSRILLLSDGESTTGRSSVDASAAALEAKVRVSTIAFGTRNGRVRVEGRAFDVPVLYGELRAIAKATRGTFYRAASSVQLNEIYDTVRGQVGYHKQFADESTWFAVAAVVLGLLTLAATFAWSARVP